MTIDVEGQVLNMGIGMVVPARLLREILDRSDLVAGRERMRRIHEPGTTMLHVVGGGLNGRRRQGLSSRDDPKDLLNCYLGWRVAF